MEIETEKPKDRRGWKNRPEGRLNHRGIEKTYREWALFCDVTKSAFYGWLQRGYAPDLIDQTLRRKGLMP